MRRSRALQKRHAMFDDTLMVEIDHALDVYCLLQGRMPAGARHMRKIGRAHV